MSTVSFNSVKNYSLRAGENIFLLELHLLGYSHCFK